MADELQAALLHRAGCLHSKVLSEAIRDPPVALLVLGGPFAGIVHARSREQEQSQLHLILTP